MLHKHSSGRLALHTNPLFSGIYHIVENGSIFFLKKNEQIFTLVAED
jgi:hypothetical protein